MNIAVDPTSFQTPVLAGDEGHRVGPNAIIQTLAALEAFGGARFRMAVLTGAGLGWMASRAPTQMVRVEAVNALNQAVHDALSDAEAEAVMRDAGVRTARYILANRIPKPAQRLLGMLPRRLAVRLLLKAIAKNAWTFAGKAEVRVGANWIAIYDNPVCLGRSGFSGCVWHQAVFATLMSEIIGKGLAVRETHCVGRGDPMCRFEIAV